MSPADAATTAVDGRTERWREYRKQRREELVDAAIEAINLHGPDARMEQIAAVAGTAKPKLYRHFADRAELVEAVGLRVTETIISRLAESFSPKASAREGLRAALDAYLGYVEASPNVFRFLLDNASTGSGVPNPVVDNARMMARLFVALASTDLEAAHVPTDAADPLAHALIGAVLGATDWWMLADETTTMSRERLVEHLTTVLVGAAKGVLDAAGVPFDPDAPSPWPVFPLSADL